MEIGGTKAALVTSLALIVLVTLGQNWRRRIRKRVFLERLGAEGSELMECHTCLQLFKKGDRYLRKGVTRKLRGRLERLDSVKLSRKGVPLVDSPLVPVMTSIQEFLQDSEVFRTDNNERFVEAETLRWGPFFSSFEKHPLTAEQSRAVITDEKNNLIVAAAGSGKTSTILARAAYLLKKQEASDDEILLLAFGRNAADLLRERIKERTGRTVHVKTFHALGLEIINTVNKGSRLGVLPDDQNQTQRKRLIQRAITEASREPCTLSLLITFFANHLRLFRDEFSFESEGEYKEYLKHNSIRSLNGDPVKSYGECVIANYLLRNGVKYKYEARYPYNYGPDVRRAYQPDFTIQMPREVARPDVYIEYWGVDKHGQTKPSVDSHEYRAGMLWKRKTHKKHGTPLIELSYADLQDGVLEQRLEEQLRVYDVPTKPVDNAQLFERLVNESLISELVGLVSPVLGYMRATNGSIADLRKRAEEIFSGIAQVRARAFLGILEPIALAYADYLKKEGFVDYDEMIGRATGYVRSGTYTSSFRHILVDEFQDISRARANLIVALRDQRDDATLFCVGDDWQSIFRFAGSDVNLFTEFESEFGDTAVSRLEKTFRFNNRIASVSSAFVMRNPSQVRKSLQPFVDVQSPKVFMVPNADSAVDVSKIRMVLEILNEGASGRRDMVYIIGRYRIERKDSLKSFLQNHGFSNLVVEYKTAHAAKGSEADHVIIVDLEAGRYGFPNELVDDPLLQLAHSKPEPFRHAEERRLFYVALTRARDSVYLIVPKENRSEFVRELSDPRGGVSYDVSCLEVDESGEEDPCPACKRGRLVETQGKAEAEPHKRCSLYPYCGYRNLEFCDVPYCGGYMRRLRGRYGEFWGCSNWKRDGEGCGNTRKI